MILVCKLKRVRVKQTLLHNVHSLKILELRETRRRKGEEYFMNCDIQKIRKIFTLKQIF